MAEPSNIGALGGLGGLTTTSKSDMNTISQGLQSKNNAIANVFGYDITPTNVMTTALGYAVPALSAPMTAFGLAKNYDTNRVANNALGRNTNIRNNLSGKALADIRGYLDVDKNGIVSEVEANTGFGYDYGNVNDVVSGFSPFGPGTNVTTRGDVDQFGFSTNPNTYSSREAANIGQDVQSGIGRGVDTVGLGVGSKAGYTGSVGNAFGFGKAEGVDTDDPNSTGASTGIGGSAAGVSGMGGTTSSSANTGYADDAQASGGGGGGTYICTALYEMGDMKKSIYKYDQIYGKQVDPATYRGYELWGKYVATKLRKKGIVYKIAKPIALTWANQMAYDLSKGKIGKNSTLIKITKTIGEGACYVLGQIFKRRKLWLKST